MKKRTLGFMNPNFTHNIISKYGAKSSKYMGYFPLYLMERSDSTPNFAMEWNLNPKFLLEFLKTNQSYSFFENVHPHKTKNQINHSIKDGASISLKANEIDVKSEKLIERISEKSTESTSEITKEQKLNENLQISINTYLSSLDKFMRIQTGNIISYNEKSFIELIKQRNEGMRDLKNNFYNNKVIHNGHLIQLLNTYNNTKSSEYINNEKALGNQIFNTESGQENIATRNTNSWNHTHLNTYQKNIESTEVIEMLTESYQSLFNRYNTSIKLLSQDKKLHLENKNDYTRNIIQSTLKSLNLKKDKILIEENHEIILLTEAYKQNQTESTNMMNYNQNNKIDQWDLKIADKEINIKRHFNNQSQILQNSLNNWVETKLKDNYSYQIENNTIRSRSESKQHMSWVAKAKSNQLIEKIYKNVENSFRFNTFQNKTFTNLIDSRIGNKFSKITILSEYIGSPKYITVKNNIQSKLSQINKRKAFIFNTYMAKQDETHKEQFSEMNSSNWISQKISNITKSFNTKEMMQRSFWSKSLNRWRTEVQHKVFAEGPNKELVFGVRNHEIIRSKQDETGLLTQHFVTKTFKNSVEKLYGKTYLHFEKNVNENPHSLYKDISHVFNQTIKNIEIRKNKNEINLHNIVESSLLTIDYKLKNLQQLIRKYDIKETVGYAESNFPSDYISNNTEMNWQSSKMTIMDTLSETVVETINRLKTNHGIIGKWKPLYAMAYKIDLSKNENRFYKANNSSYLNGIQDYINIFQQSIGQLLNSENHFETIHEQNVINNYKTDEHNTGFFKNSESSMVHLMQETRIDQSNNITYEQYQAGGRTEINYKKEEQISFDEIREEVRTEQKKIETKFEKEIHQLTKTIQESNEDKRIQREVSKDIFKKLKLDRIRRGL